MSRCGGNLTVVIGSFVTRARIIVSYPGFTFRICPWPLPLKDFLSLKFILVNSLNHHTITLRQM